MSDQDSNVNPVWALPLLQVPPSQNRPNDPPMIPGELPRPQVPGRSDTLVLSVEVTRTAEGQQAIFPLGDTSVLLERTDSGNVRLAGDTNKDGEFTPNETIYNSLEVKQVGALLNATGSLLGKSDLGESGLRADESVSRGVASAFRDDNLNISELVLTMQMTNLTTQIQRTELDEAKEIVDSQRTPAVPAPSGKGQVI